MDLSFIAEAYGRIQGVELPEVIGGTPVNTWLNENSLVYRIQLSGGYRKGRPNVSNDFSMRIYPANGLSTEDDACKLAAKIADMLRMDQFRQTLYALQAHGRFFYLKHTSLVAERAIYWTGKSWSDDLLYAMRFCDAVELIRVLEDLSYLDGTLPASVEVCIEDTEAYVDPVNHEGCPYVVLRSLKSPNACITSSKLGENPTILSSGRRGYDLVGYASDLETAQLLWAKALSTLE